MGIIQKQGAIATSINYVGVVVAYINLVFILPHFLSLTEIGLLRLIVEAATLLMLFFQFGSPYLVIRFFPRFQNSDTESRAFYTVAISFGLVGICLLALGYGLFREAFLNYFSEKSPLINDFEKPFLLIASSLILFNVFERIFGSKKIVIIPSLFKELIFRLGLSLVVILIGLKVLSLSEGVNVWVGFYFLATFTMFYLYKRKFGLRFSFDKSVWNKGNFRKFLGYSLIVSLGSIGGGLSIKIDMLMTSSMLGLEQLAIYGTMVYMATVIEIPKRALVQISDPFISEYYTSGRIDKIGELYKKNSVVLLVMGIFLLLGIYANLPYLFQIMPQGEEFATGINVFLIIAIVKLLSLLSGITNQILLNSVAAWVSSATIILLAIMSIGLNYYFIPIYGLEGAALATLISVGINHLLTMLYVYMKFKIHPFCKELLILGVVFIGFMAGIYFSPGFENPWLGLLATTLLIGTTFPFLIWKLNISPDANQMAFQIIDKIKGVISKA